MMMMMMMAIIKSSSVATRLGHSAQLRSGKVGPGCPQDSFVMISGTELHFDLGSWHHPSHISTNMLLMLKIMSAPS